MECISFRKLSMSLLNACTYLLHRYTIDKTIDPQRFSRLFKKAQMHLNKFIEVPIDIRLDSSQYLSYEQKVLWMQGLTKLIHRELALKAIRTHLNSMKTLHK
jgi:hypothetical protein